MDNAPTFETLRFDFELNFVLIADNAWGVDVVLVVGDCDRSDVDGLWSDVANSPAIKPHPFFFANIIEDGFVDIFGDNLSTCGMITSVIIEFSINTYTRKP